MAETQLGNLAVYSARPTVRLNGQAQPKVSNLLTHMEMTEREGGMSALELRFDNVASDTQGSSDFSFENDSLLRLGAAIGVYCGDESAPVEIFRGLITGLEFEFSESSPPELTILAEDAFQLARMARRTKVHQDVSLKKLAEDLAKRLGLKPVVTGFISKIGTHVQLNESDLAFLRRLLVRYDGDLQVVGAELHVSPRGEVRRGAIEIVRHGQLRSARLLADLSHQVTEVTVAGWDPVRGRRVKGLSRGAKAGPGTGRAGSKVLKDSIGARSEHFGQLAVSTDEEAKALADAVFVSRARQFVRVEATAEGNPALRVGTHVTLSDLGPRFSNTYYVVRALHRFDRERGYETEFEAECAYLGGP